MKVNAVNTFRQNLANYNKPLKIDFLKIGLFTITNEIFVYL